MARKNTTKRSAKENQVSEWLPALPVDPFGGFTESPLASRLAVGRSAENAFVYELSPVAFSAAQMARILVAGSPLN